MINEEWAKDQAKENAIIRKHAQKLSKKLNDVNKKFDRSLDLVKKQSFVLENFAINISFSLQLNRVRTMGLITEICKYYPKDEVLEFFKSIEKIYSRQVIIDWYKELGPNENYIRLEMKDFCY